MYSGTLKKCDRLDDTTVVIRVNVLGGKEYFQKSRSLTQLPQVPSTANFSDADTSWLPSVSYIFFALCLLTLMQNHIFAPPPSTHVTAPGESREEITVSGSFVYLLPFMQGFLFFSAFLSSKTDFSRIFLVHSLCGTFRIFFRSDIFT